MDIPMNNIDEDGIEEYVPHPYGVKPKGNYYFDSLNLDFVDSRTLGLGSFSIFEDNFIIDFLDHFTAKELCTVVNRLSKAFYIYVQEEEQWKMRCIDRFQDGEFVYHHSWQYTYKSNMDRFFKVEPVPITVKYFYSDYLFHIWRCSSISMKQWEDGDSIDRRSNLTIEEFTKEYLIPNRPVIITDATKDWNAKDWTRESLMEKCGDVKLYVNSGVFMTMKNFLSYVSECKEEMPMYLFDHYYGEKIPDILKDYSTDYYFKEDFFSVLGDKRPSYRWLLFGPARSGATFHKDPNHTSAWNAVITGRKKWVMYPPHVVPPGVYPSDDGLEVTAPSSIMEWFVNYYEKNEDTNNSGKKKKKNNNGNAVDSKKQQFKLKNKKGQQSQQQPEEEETYETVKPLEGILGPGEMIFVPCGWWHTVLNLEESIAITHNFINSYNITKVIDFMKTKKKKDLYENFVKSFEEQYPGKLDEIRQRESQTNQIKKEEPKKKKPSLWESTVNSSRNNNSSDSTVSNTNNSKPSFSFQFNFTPEEDGEEVNESEQ
eukprot:gene4096-5124_t